MSSVPVSLKPDKNRSHTKFPPAVEPTPHFPADNRTKNVTDHGGKPGGMTDANMAKVKIPAKPSLEPYVGKLERFELFSTNQCYYLVGCNKLNTAYRVLKMNRTLIERPPEHNHASGPSGSPMSASARAPYAESSSIDSNSHSLHYHPPPTGSSESQAALADNSHTAKPTLRPLSDFLTEDPNVYSQEEIKDMLDMIHDGNRMTRADGTPGDLTGKSGGGGLKPIVKAYGVVGFIRFLDCYYLTLITRRAKVGSIGGNGIYTIKVRVFYVTIRCKSRQAQSFASNTCVLSSKTEH
jgi:hypothetical protein